MFGYICINEQELKIREITAYRSFYCGLCRNLHMRYGRIAQLMLNYDMTFLALVLTGLYEPETECTSHRCIPHPFQKHRALQNDAISYAADMCILLSWQKFQDDWQDEHSVTGLTGRALLNKAYQEVKQRYPRQAGSIEECIQKLHQAERENLHDIDAVSGLTGRFLADLFVWKEDCWEQDLRSMGFYLGKFIYLMDAIDDIEKDLKRQNFNLFKEYSPIWGTPGEAEIRGMLMSMMTEVAFAFEKLPILENAELIRNILYSGVWCKYVLMKENYEAKHQDKHE